MTSVVRYEVRPRSGPTPCGVTMHRAAGPAQRPVRAMHWRDARPRDGGELKGAAMSNRETKAPGIARKPRPRGKAAGRAAKRRASRVVAARRREAAGAEARAAPSKARSAAALGAARGGRMPTRVGVGAKKRRRRSAATTSRRAENQPPHYGRSRAYVTRVHQAALISAEISPTRPPHTNPR